MFICNFSYFPFCFCGKNLGYDFYRVGGFFIFYYSAKLPINSTYNVGEKFGTEERAIFSRALLSKLLTSQRKKSQRLLEHFFQRNNWRDRFDNQ